MDILKKCGVERENFLKTLWRIQDSDFNSVKTVKTAILEKVEISTGTIRYSENNGLIYQPSFQHSV